MDRFIEQTSIYGFVLSDDENANSMTKMFVKLHAEVITQVSRCIHEEISNFFHAEYFEETLEEKDSPLAALHGIQDCFIISQNQCVQATEELSRLVIEPANQRPTTMKDLKDVDERRAQQLEEMEHLSIA